MNALEALIIFAHLSGFAAWVWAVVDATKRNRSYRWIFATAIAPFTLWTTAVFYLTNFLLMPRLGMIPVTETFKSRMRIQSLSSEVSGPLAKGRALEELATIHFRMGQWKECLDTLKRALDIDPEYLRGHYEAGVCLLRLGKPPEAATHLEYVLGEDPSFEYGEAQLRYAECLAATGRNEEADAKLAWLWSHWPSVEGAVYLARRHEAAGKVFEARETLQRALDLGDPPVIWQLPNHRRWRGEARAMLTRLPKA